MSAQISEIDIIQESLVDIKLAEAALAVARDRLQWNSCRDFFGPVVNALTRIGSEPYLSSGTLYVSMTGDKQKLTQAFRIFRTAGMEFSGDRPKKGDSSWSAVFKHQSQTVYVFFQFTSSVCRRVKVGTKTVEQDIYETQCGDLSTDEPAPLLTIVPPVAALEADEVPF
jgi:hypothetical protein